MNQLYTLIVTATLLLLSGCDRAETTAMKTASTDAPRDEMSVQQIGAMRAVMREGNTEARIKLVDVIARPHAIAVGALEGLGGEITIVDGDVWVSRVGADGSLSVRGPEPAKDDSATLLTVSHVEQWVQTQVDASLEGTNLEAFIADSARVQGIDTTKPFPFRIEGKLSRISIHVISGYCPIATDPETQAKKPWRWSASEPTNVTIVGFYAPNKVAVMTHHGTSIHAHAIVTVDGERRMGHIDSVVLEPGMTLSVPGSKRGRESFSE